MLNLIPRTLRIVFTLGAGIGKLKHIQKHFPLLVRPWLFVFGVMGGKKSFSQRLEHLGPSFIKLGQTLSTRPDILGKELAKDLERLRDKLPPFAQDVARRTVSEELGNVDALFDRWEPCISAASIAQVHRVRLAKERKWMALKILRPGIRRRMARDFSLFHRLARSAERFFPHTRRLHFKEIVHTLEQNVAVEMDLRMEAAAIEEMTQCTRKHHYRFKLPKVDWRHTTGNVLLTSWITGTSLGDLSAIDAAGYDRSFLAESLLKIFFTQVLEEGFFHADLHPGNLFVCEDGHLAAVDWGITGRLDKKNLMAMGGLLVALVSRDYNKAADIHLRASYVPRGTDKALFAQALRSITEPILDQPVHHISMGTLLLRLFEVSGHFHMNLQPQLLFFQRTLVVVEGVARSLDPTLNFWDVCKPLFLAWQRKLPTIPFDISELTECLEAGSTFLRTVIENTTKTPLPVKSTQRKHLLLIAILLFVLGIITAYIWQYIWSLFML